MTGITSTISTLQYSTSWQTSLLLEWWMKIDIFVDNQTRSSGCFYLVKCYSFYFWTTNNRLFWWSANVKFCFNTADYSKYFNTGRVIACRVEKLPKYDCISLVIRYFNQMPNIYYFLDSNSQCQYWIVYINLKLLKCIIVVLEYHCMYEHTLSQNWIVCQTNLNYTI